MIFVTVGTEQFPFNRLRNWVAEAIEKRTFQEKVVVQLGSCTEEVPGADNYRYLDQSAFNETVRRARVVVSHCGEGSYFSLVQARKPFILVPRRHGLGEHVDDHQWEMARGLSSTGVPVAWIPDDLARFARDPFLPPVNQFELPTLNNHLIAQYG